MHVCTVTPISENAGANRIVPGQAIPYPLGNVELSSEDEKNFRRQIVETALTALTTHITEPAVFKWKQRP